MRSPLWFVVAGVIAIAGFVAAGLYLWPRLGSIDAGMIRVVVPGHAMLDLGKAGTYTIFHEKQSVVDGRFYASDSVSGLRVDVIAEATGAAAVKLDALAAEVGAGVGDQQPRLRRDLGGRAHAGERHPGQCFLARLRGGGDLFGVGSDRAGRDRVHGDTLGPELHRQAFAQ